MKLWQKVFLLTLLLMIVTIELTSYLVLRQNFDMNSRREQELAVSLHESICAGITNNVLFSRLRTDKLMLTAEETAAVLRQMGTSNPGEGVGMAVYDGSEIVAGYRDSIIRSNEEFRSRGIGQDICAVTVYAYGRQTYIVAGSLLTLENHEYSVYSSVNITATYESFRSQLRYVQIITVVSSGVLSVVFLVMVLYLLSPLSDINRTIRQIAKGDYSLRIKMKGGREFRELSKNLNFMTQSIENNMSEIQSLADGRKRFIDSFAHEMKTPLTSILGFADILRVKRSVTESELREYSSIIVEETKRLQGLSGKLLQLAGVTDAPLELSRIPVSELFAEAAETTIHLMQGKRLTLAVQVPDDAVIYADRALFLSLLLNLTDNAAKASLPGQEIRLGCELTGGSVYIYVSDDGAGIPPDQIRKIAEPFYMIDKSRSRKEGGAGLGLAICVEIAKAHSALLSVKSVPGEGTTVFVKIPPAPAASGSRLNNVSKIEMDAADQIGSE